MERDLENHPFIPRAADDTRLVKGNKLRIRRHHVRGGVFARDMYHTLLSLSAPWIGVILVGSYVTIVHARNIRF